MKHFIDSIRRRLQPSSRSRPLYLFNTMGREKQQFHMHPRSKVVRIYSCGPTVYGVQHIGNLSMYVFIDILRKALEANGMPVKQVINITDFGHLVSDADEGEDKMTKGLKRDGHAITMENMHTMAEKYAEIFLADIAKLNVPVTDIQFPRASAYVSNQIAMIQTLMEKGYAYKTGSGVYYDVSRFPDYGKLGDIDLGGLQEGARVASRSDKHGPYDFLLWKPDKHLGWDSPWSHGFPGWHIECSAMARALLGEQIDIHTGGIEHVAIHHNNEIAQSEAATGRKPFARFWMHRNHIQAENTKISKSLGNTFYMDDIIKKGYHPLSLRYLFLGAHYRSSLNFTWESLDAAETALMRLYAFMDMHAETGTAPAAYVDRFFERINDDLDTPGALAVLWEMAKDVSLPTADIRAGLIAMDAVLGLSLADPDDAAKKAWRRRFGEEVALENVPAEIYKLIKDRDVARAAKDWSKADAIRDSLHKKGYEVKDSPEGVVILKK
jgi:cysteinyl-tRNA synthetase